MEILCPLASFLKPSVRNLVVSNFSTATLDSALTLVAHVKSLVHSCFYHLKHCQSEMEMIIHAFISSCLDYCNSMFTCLSAAVRLLTKSSKYSNVTLLQTQLHWLPVHYGVHFRMLVLTFRALHGQASTYIREQLQPYIPSRSMRSCDQGLLALQQTQLKTKGDGAFAKVALELRSSEPEIRGLCDLF